MRGCPRFKLPAVMRSSTPQQVMPCHCHDSPLACVCTLPDSCQPLTVLSAGGMWRWLRSTASHAP